MEEAAPRLMTKAGKTGVESLLGLGRRSGGFDEWGFRGEADALEKWFDDTWLCDGGDLLHFVAAVATGEGIDPGLPRIQTQVGRISNMSSSVRMVTARPPTTHTKPTSHVERPVRKNRVAGSMAPPRIGR